MKRITLSMVNVIYIFTMLFSLSSRAYADDGIYNHFLDTSTQSEKTDYDNTENRRNPDGLEIIKGTGDAKRITLPDENCYFDEPRVMYIYASKKNSAIGFSKPDSSSKEQRYPYYGSRVLALAEQNGFSCIVYNDHMNESHTVWVPNSSLTSSFPGTEYIIGEQNKEDQRVVGDVSVRWSNENIEGTHQKFTVLQEPVNGCVQFTLDYQVYSRNGATTNQVLGPRRIYVNDGTGWFYIGQFAYPEIDAVHAVVCLPKPMDIKAVATVASCEKPDVFRFRQCVLDVVTEE